MRVVVDTNVWISAFMSRNGLPFKVIRLWLDREYDLVTSLWQIEEFQRVTRNEKVRARLTPSEVGAFINDIRRSAIVLDGLPQVEYSPDPDDNPIIAAGLAGDAQYIVSGDKRDVQAMGQIQGVKVLTAREFIADIPHPPRGFW